MKKHNDKNILSKYISKIRRMINYKYDEEYYNKKSKPAKGLNEVEELELKRNQYIFKLDDNIKQSRVLYLFGVIFVLGGLLFLIDPDFKDYREIGGSILLFSSMFFGIGKSYKINEIKEDILSIDSEIYFLKAQKLEEVEKAERIFKYHQSELKKYYDQTLEHNKKIFWTGISCILLGVVIIFTTMIIILYADKILNINTSDNVRLLTAIFGGIGTILTNFIAVIYLKMYSETIKSLSAFHSRLVTTHHLHLANSINSKIVDIKLRDKTFAESTLEIIKTTHLWELFDKSNTTSLETKEKGKE